MASYSKSGKRLGRPPKSYKDGKGPARPKKTVMLPGDPDNEFAVGVAKTITGYLQQDHRLHKVQLSLNDREFAMIKEAAKLQRTPASTIVRACAMWGIAMYLEAKKPKPKEEQ